MKPETAPKRSSNVPGLIATGVVKKQNEFSSPKKIREAEVSVHDSSFDSNFEYEYLASGSVKVDELNTNKNERAFHHGGINISSLNKM